MTSTRTRGAPDFRCPLTPEDARRAAESLAEKTSKKGETFTIGACDLASDEEARCEVVYYPPEGFECTGEIIVTLTNNGSSTNSRNDVTCD